MAIKQALEAAFAPIEQDTTLLERCYVKTRESEEAADHLTRMALVLEHKLLDAAEDYPKRVKEQIPRREDGNALTTLARKPGFLARIVGQSSSGKSVFLSRFFRIDLKADHRERLVLVYLDCQSFDPERPPDLSTTALKELKRRLFGREMPAFEDLTGIYREKWIEWRDLYGLDESDLDFRKKFIDEIIDTERRQPLDALAVFCHFAIEEKRIIPCAVPVRAIQTLSQR